MPFFTQLASFFLNNPLLGGLFIDTGKYPTAEAFGQDFKGYQWLYPVLTFIDSAFVPIIIVVAAVGGIWCIFLGVNLARAESADKADEAKKRLINVVIALVASILLIFLLSLFVSQIPAIFGSSTPTSKPTT